MSAYFSIIFTGAFLLFLVQPLMARFILPWFGGSSAVWTTCMLFYQAFLLVGYAYAHASSRCLSPRRQALLHGALVLTALLFIPIIPSVHWKPGSTDEPTWRILALLTATIGLPYLVLSATSPLLQKWFTLTHPESSPYRLYALSNAGSLLALMAYPVLFEPLMSRKVQAAAWAWGLGVYALLALWCSVRLWWANPAPDQDGAPALTDQPDASPVDKTLWFLLPLCGAVLLLSLTNKLCQNVVAFPFLWVLPLSLYLLTFIVCFDRPRWYRRGWLTWMLAPALGLICAMQFKGDRPLLEQVAVYCGGLFLFCLVCHGEVYRLKPSPRQLTLYYLLIAAGGAGGGILVALVAPLVFETSAEMSWGLCGLGALVTFVHARDRTVWVLFQRRWPVWPVLAAGTVALAGVLAFQSKCARLGVVATHRDFYGPLRVEEICKRDPTDHGFEIFHGTISHGTQFAEPVKARMPTSYYGELSGVGVAMLNLPGKTNRHVGIVGLGAGTLATYGKPGDRFRFYEINPAVYQLATTWFTYLTQCEARVDVVFGDARLSLEQEPSQQFDLLVLDAFSGDATPVHLLTREAFQTYLRHLKPDGVIAVHISNHHVDFFPVMLGVADQFGMAMVYIPWTTRPMPNALCSSDWILITRNRAFLNASPVLSRSRPPRTPGATNAIAWTDDYASLFRVLR